jgi:predicted Zn-dependent protease
MSKSRALMKRCFVVVLLSGLAGSLAGGFAGCGTITDPYGRPIEPPLSTAQGEVTGRAAFALLTTQQEIDLGHQVSQEIESHEVRYPDAQVQAYVESVGNRLAAYASRHDIPYTFVVIDNPNSINAFSVAGGRTYVYTGLLKLASNEAELAAVLAHEIAHLALHHHAAKITRQYGFDTITGIILGQNLADKTRLATDLINGSVQATFTSEQERTADELAMQMMTNAGYNPEAMLSMLQKLRAATENQKYIPILASQPPSDERLQRIEALLQTFPAATRSDAPIYMERYQEEVVDKL